MTNQALSTAPEPERAETAQSPLQRPDPLWAIVSHLMKLIQLMEEHSLVWTRPLRGRLCYICALGFRSCGERLIWHVYGSLLIDDSTTPPFRQKRQNA